jgi:hypothetical protein
MSKYQFVPFLFKELDFSQHVIAGQTNSHITNKKIHQFDYHVNQAMNVSLFKQKFFFHLALGKSMITSSLAFGQKAD